MLGFIVEKMAKHKEEIGSITLDYNSGVHRGTIKGYLRIEGRSGDKRMKYKRMKEDLEMILVNRITSIVGWLSLKRRACS